MDYEKKYKEAVNKIRDLLDDGEKNGFTIVTYKTDLESIFPELKESEDEKIKKWLIGYFHQYKEDGMEKYANGLKVESIIDWLEKQGEQKSQRMISAEAKEAMYGKPAWSEEDEKMLVDAYVMLDWYKGNNWWTARRIKDWLNSLKERIGG